MPGRYPVAQATASSACAEYEYPTQLSPLSSLLASVQPTEMKVTIKQWNAVAAWRWDMPEDDMCGICRNPYDSTCTACKFPGDECPLRMF